MRAFILFLLLIGAMDAQAADHKRKYPPYPEVWGRFLPDPPKDSRWRRVSVHEREDGEILIAFREKKFGGISPGETVGAMEFFGGDVNMGKEAYTHAVKALPKFVISPFNTRLGIEPRLSVLSSDNTDEEDCYSSFWAMLLRHQKYLNEPDAFPYISTKSIIYVHPKPRYFDISRGCGNKTPNVPYEERVVALSFYFFPLREHSFLAYAWNANLIIRFDRNLSTTFIHKNKTKMFMFDWNTIANFRRSSRDPSEQRDAVEAFLKAQTKR